MPADDKSSFTPDQVRLRDPLSEVTRKERRGLLGVSMLGIAVAKANLVPTEITSLGVKLAATEQSTLLLLLGLVCLYYLVAFAIYATSDYLAWKVALGVSVGQLWELPADLDDSEERSALRAQRQSQLQEHLLKHELPILASELLARPVSSARAAFEFLLPLFVGGYAVYTLFSTRAA